MEWKNSKIVFQEIPIEYIGYGEARSVMEERILETVLTERRVPPSCSYKSARTELYGLLVVSSETFAAFFPSPLLLAIRARIHSIARSYSEDLRNTS